MKLKYIAAAGVLAALHAIPSSAAVITLDFEGLADLQPVGDYYLASTGVSFSPATLAIIDSDAGGTGNFEIGRAHV